MGICGLPSTSTRQQGSHATDDCLLAAALPSNRVMFRHLSTDGNVPPSIQLPLIGKSWRLLAGAAIDCEKIRLLLAGTWEPPVVEDTAIRKCLIIVGWDGAVLP